eukprot:734394-Pyramimonas_sp.AAC.1
MTKGGAPAGVVVVHLQADVAEPLHALAEQRLDDVVTAERLVDAAEVERVLVPRQAHRHLLAAHLHAAQLTHRRLCLRLAGVPYEAEAL